MRSLIDVMRVRSRCAAASANLASSTTITYRCAGLGKSAFHPCSAMASTSRDAAPAAAVFRQQPLARGRAFAPGAIPRQALAAGVAPGLHERLHPVPAGLDTVGARIENGVADHAVIDQRLVAGRRRHLEIILVFER